MNLLYCDESNLQPREGDFLLYGGILVPGNEAGLLSKKIDEIRLTAGMPSDAKLKFNPVPDGMSHEQFRDLKQQVIQAAIDHGCKLFTYLVLHDLTKDPDESRRFGINTVCYNYHCTLTHKDEIGIVLIDRFNDEGNKIDGHLKDKMGVGVQLPHKDEPTRLSQIIGFHYAAVGQSNFTSLIDIIIGSFRFSINAHCRGDEKLQKAAREILGLMEPLFYSRYKSSICDMGITFPPMKVKVARYRDQYVSLQTFLRNCGVNSGQNL